MDPKQINKVSAFFSERRSRRAAIQGAAAVAAAGVVGGGLNAAAQESTSEAPRQTELLFVQSFQSGSIAAKDGQDGAYTVTLENGVGSTIYFTDRPDRIVGSTPTAQFVQGFSFGAENPPNAALVISNDDGETDIAVVELTNPVYDEASSTATYDMQVLENFDDFGGTFQSDPVDLAEVAASFGTAHLFIDDCSNQPVTCIERATTKDRVIQDPMLYFPFCYQWGQCQPCEPYFHSSPSPCATWYHWIDVCNANPQSCPDGNCFPWWGDALGINSNNIGCP